MTKPIVASTRISKELSDRIDLLADELDRSRAWVLKQAIERYISEELEFIDFIKEGEAAIERGDFYTQEEMEQWIEERRRPNSAAAA